MRARAVPATMAKWTPSRSVSTAACAAFRASWILPKDMDPEVSTMITSAAWAVGAAPSAGPEDSTVRIACTSVPPTGRYLFWSTRIVNRGWSVT